MEYQAAAGYLIRPAAPSDLPAVLRMRQALIEHLEEANPEFCLPAAATHLAYAERFLSRAGDECALWLVAEAPDGVVVAMGEIHLLPSTIAEEDVVAKINDVWVDPEHRRRGLATTISETLLVFAQSRAVGRVRLDWVAGNHEAEALWRHLGFEPVVVTASLSLACRDE
jgi:GNAT superfamily N-acetyltransferase